MKKKITDIIVKLFSRACFLCVFVSFFITIIAQLIKNADTDGGIVAISLPQYALYFLFSFLIAAASYLFLIPVARPLRYLIHFAACASVFLIIFSIAGKISLASVSSSLKSIVLCLVFYLIGLLFFLLFKRLTMTKNGAKESETQKNEKPIYEKRF